MATSTPRGTYHLPTLLLCAWLTLLTTGSAAEKASWWNPEWTIRKKVTVDTTATGGAITEPVGTALVLIRLHDGNFQFLSGKPDGDDLRFVSADDKTLLPYHIEKFDSLLNEAFIWVKVPDVKPVAQNSFWLYYGNTGDTAAKASDSKASIDADTVLVYHFGEKGAPAGDATGNGNNAEKAGLSADGSLIGGGLRFTGQNPVTIPASPTLAWTPISALTWSAWIKPTALAPNAILFSRREGGNFFRIGADDGVPFVEVKSAAGTQRTPVGAPLIAGAWRHLAVVATGSQIGLFLDGEPYATLAAALPALNSPALLGGDVEEGAADIAGFTGELDELEISKVARTPGVLKLAAISQGTGDKAAKLLAVGAEESSAHGAEGELAKQLSMMKDISKSLSFDGWVVIVLCILLAVVGWVITAIKFVYLSKIKKATNTFLKHWEHLGADFGTLDHSDEQNVKSMGGKASAKVQKVMRPSPLYHIYQIGSAEIQHRVMSANEGFKGLSGRSMEAIRATLDGGLVREVQRLNSNLVFLTIGIAGGPYLGLLGTVIGVMITFAVIAKSGAVEVNSIAPGIAGALLATVAGLAVAIPALFAYSYISSRIKDAVSEMQIFIDEFVAKIAEVFPHPND